MTKRLPIAIALCATMALCACGGGGGGGGNPPAPAPPTPPATRPSGDFTLSDTSVSFASIENQAASSKDIALTVTAPAGVAIVGAAYPAGQGVPSWLSVVILGTMPNFTVRLVPLGAAAGHYEATLLVGTADQAENILKFVQVDVTYDVGAAIFYGGPRTTLHTFVLGHSNQTVQLPVNVQTAAAGTWTLASNAPWITVPAGTQQGSANLGVTVDASTLGVGNHTATVSIQNAQFAPQRFTIDVTADIRTPTFAVTSNSVALGGADGLGSAAQPFSATLNTGSNAYPWTVSLSDGQLGWLTSSAPSGTVSGNQNATVNLGFDRSKVAPGTYGGTARFDVNVKGVILSASAPVTLNLESHRLFPQYDGVALSSFPSRQTLTRNIEIASSRDRTNVPWTATSDQPWLTVTASGSTGDSVQLSADPTGLPQNQSHIAIVTLSSTDPTIERSEQIRVGMWVGSTDPVDTLSDPLPHTSEGYGPNGLAVNPVEPLAYTIRVGDTVHVHNVYSGALVNTFTPTGLTAAAAIGVSGDGRLMFVTDFTTGVTFLLNATTGAVVRTYPTTAFSISQRGFIYARPNGHPVVWTANAEIFDLETNTRLTAGMATHGIRAATPDGRKIIAMQELVTVSNLALISQRFSALGQRSLDVQVLHSTPFDPLRTGLQVDLAISASGERSFSDRSFSNGSAGVKVYRLDPTVLTDLPDIALPDYPMAIEAAWNGRIYVGLGDPAYSGDNLLAFDELGNLLGSSQSGEIGGGRYRAQLGLSGDLTRVVSTHPVPNGPNPITQYVLSFYSLPP